MNNDDSNTRQTVAVLWTGGWDSTYRVIELSKKDINIQPVYILDEGRKSNRMERQAIERITGMLQKRKETRAVFLPVDVINVADIPADAEVTAAWRKLSEEFDWGIQHDWTARVAQWKYPMIEMCIEKIVHGHTPTRMAIEKYGAVKPAVGGGNVIDQEKSDRVLNLVLGNITLPIYQITEVEMLRNVEEWGYMDVMENIWFCHDPIGGKPCGLCGPCHTKMDSHMEFLLPAASQRRCRRLCWIKEHLGKYPGKVYAVLARKWGSATK